MFLGSIDVDDDAPHLIVADSDPSYHNAIIFGKYLLGAHGGDYGGFVIIHFGMEATGSKKSVTNNFFWAPTAQKVPFSLDSDRSYNMDCRVVLYLEDRLPI